MGCCCCCIRARKQDTDPGPDPFAGRAGASQPDTNLNPDTEIKIEEIGSPRRYFLAAKCVHSNNREMDKQAFLLYEFF